MTNRINSNKTTSQNNVIDGVKIANQENNNMNSNNNQNTTSTFNAQTVFENRRVWTAPVREARIALTNEQIDLMTPAATIKKLFTDGTFRISQNASGSRQDATPVLFSSGPQNDQLGRALALFTSIPYIAQFTRNEAGYKSIALLDKTGNSDMLVYEIQNAETGWIDYSVFYASKVTNQHGQAIGLNETSEDPISQWLKDSIDNGYVGFDGKARQGYNQWVDSYNAAILARAKGVATDEQKEMTKKAQDMEDANLFVQYNSRRHINSASVANKYAILSWLALNQDKPALELYNRAKTAETNEAFINGVAQMATRGFRNQLRTLAGLYSTVE